MNNFNKNFVYFFFGIALITGLYIYSNKCVDIDSLKYEIVKFSEIPTPVQNVFLNRFSENYEPSSTPIENTNPNDWFVNLDSNLYLVKYKRTTVPGLFKGKIKLQSVRDCYCLSHFELYRGAPFLIYYEKKLYLMLFQDELEVVNIVESNVKIFVGLEF